MTWLLWCGLLTCACVNALRMGDECVQPLSQFTNGPRPFAVRADPEAYAKGVTRENRLVVCRLEHRDGAVSKAWGPWTPAERAEVCG